MVGRKVGELGEVVRARKPKRLPIVLTRVEVRAVLEQLQGPNWPAASLMYGAGPRRTECLRLRVQDTDLGFAQITVRDGKGFKDRLTMLPAAVVVPLREHLIRIRETHQRDVNEGYGRVFCPTRWNRSTQARLGTGSRSGSSHRLADGGTIRAENKNIITSTSRSSSVRSSRP